MPQNLAGWLVRCFLSTFLIRFMSSLESSKSKTWKFSFNLSSFDVFGMTTVFRWIPHRRTTWATVFLYFSARFWHKRMWLLRQICFQGNFNTHTHRDYLENWIIQSWYWTKPFHVSRTTSKRSVGCDRDAMLLTEFDKRITLEVWVSFNLIHSRLHFGIG